MIKKILQAAGFVENETFRKARFLSPPPGSYAVYTDDIDTDGPDGLNSIKMHDYTVELYEPTPDDDIEQALEDAIDAEGLRWTKQDRYWLQDEQLYQVIYEFTYLEKRR